MIRQRVYLHKCDWLVDIYYDARPSNADEILDALWEFGCAREHLYKAESLLKSGVPNEGLTYSNKYERRTLIVITHASSIGEFISTTIHEVDHMVDHISQYYSIPYDSEENSYLIGDVAKTIYEDAVKNAIKIFRDYL